MTHEEIISAAIEKFGAEAQVRKAVDELTELSLALQHALDGRCNRDNILEEIADVEIMLSQVHLIFDPLQPSVAKPASQWKAEKLARLETLISQ